MVREPILLRSVLHDREIEVALTMARIEPLSTQPGPIADVAVSLDHFVSEREYIRRDFETERLSTFEIDQEGVLRRLLDGRSPGLAPLMMRSTYDATERMCSFKSMP